MITERHKIIYLTICFSCYCCMSLLTITEAATVVNALTVQQQQQQQQLQQQQLKQQHQQIYNDNAKQQQEASVFDATRVLNPRMDYNNEWRPVGRGDPLKKDPTYDYSPPVLESVHYWRDSGDKDAANGIKTETNEINENRKSGPKINKQDILLLGVTSERLRPAITAAPTTIAHKNAKGELPLLQPKYTSIRRSYYAHQLPTHLMPPPMSTQNMIKTAPSMGDYRHSMPSSYAAHPSSSSSSSSSMVTSMQALQHSKPYYSTAATSPWTHTQHGNVGGTTTTIVHHMAHSMPHMPYDSHYQESANYHSYTHPPSMSTYTTHSKPAASVYSPNAIPPSQYAMKPNSPAPRKPWVHELLQKELIKSPVVVNQRPTMPTTKYLMGTTAKPFYAANPHIGISTTFAPLVSFIPSLMTTTSTRKPPVVQMSSSYTSSPVYITTTPVPMPTPPPMISTTTTTTTTPSPFNDPTRLLIPNTSNLAFRPTVTPMEMTTDSLFSHYNQPEKPLMGPMYLIIEGHSKVKTYGKDELDPHQPKIVPIIPKREPIVRVADPNEKRGGVETFQVKHLHTINTPKPIESTTAKAVMTTTKTTTQRTTLEPKKPRFTMKPLTTTTVKTPITSEKTTIGFRPTIPTVKSQPSTILTKVADVSSPVPSQPPTGMQGLLSLLDGFFEDEPSMGAEMISSNSQTRDKQNKATDNIYVTLSTSTIRPMHSVENLPQIDARLTSKADSIAAESDDETGMTTIPPAREVRQVFDYDQLPEARLKQLLEESYDDGEDSTGVTWADEEDEYLDKSGQPIKRNDKVMDYDLDVDMKNGEEDEKAEEDDEEYDNEDDNDDENDDEEVEKAVTKDLLKHP